MSGPAATEPAMKDAEATSRFAETAMMRLHYHEAGPAAGNGTGAGTGAGGDHHPVVLLPGGGPCASRWSNLGPNLPGVPQPIRPLTPDQTGFAPAGSTTAS